MELVLIDREPLFGVGLARVLSVAKPSSRVWVHASLDEWLAQRTYHPTRVDAVIADAQTLSPLLMHALRCAEDLVPDAVRVVAIREPAELPPDLPVSVRTIPRTLAPERFVHVMLDLVQTHGRKTVVDGQQPAGIDAITPRQLEVLSLVSQGESNKRIASQLNIAERTVKLHVTALLTHLGARNRTQILVKAIELGLAAGAPARAGRQAHINGFFDASAMQARQTLDHGA